MRINEIVKALRKEQNLTQTELAQKANLSASCISMIELEEREPGANTILSLANALNVTSDYLLGRCDDFGAVNVTVAGEDLSAEEKEILHSYRALDFDARNVIRIQLKALVESKA